MLGALLLPEVVELHPDAVGTGVRLDRKGHKSSLLLVADVNQPNRKVLPAGRFGQKPTVHGDKLGTAIKKVINLTVASDRRSPSETSQSTSAMFDSFFACPFSLRPAEVQGKSTQNGLSKS